MRWLRLSSWLLSAWQVTSFPHQSRSQDSRCRVLFHCWRVVLCNLTTLITICRRRERHAQPWWCRFWARCARLLSTLMSVLPCIRRFHSGGRGPLLGLRQRSSLLGGQSLLLELSTHSLSVSERRRSYSKSCSLSAMLVWFVAQLLLPSSWRFQCAKQLKTKDASLKKITVALYRPP